MKPIHRLLAAAAGALALGAPAAQAAGEYKTPEEHDWAFEGPFGTFDQAALQRGFQVYNQVCSACHGLEYLSIRHLGMEGGPFYMEEYPNPNDNPALQSIAAEMRPIEDGPDDYGDMYERDRRVTDPFPAPYENEQMARSANGGAYPPDLSVIVKARKGGTEYIRSLLLGYGEEPPEDLEVRPGNYYNPYMSGQVIAMPPQLYEGIVEYADGTEATPEQMAHDVSAFLTWTSEPHMEARKRMGLMVMIYLLVLCGLLYWSYRQIWSKVEH